MLVQDLSIYDKVIKSFNNDNDKLRLLSVLKTDVLKLKYLNYLEDDKYKVQLIYEIKDENLKFEALDYLEDDYYKYLVAREFSNENVLKAIDKVIDTDTKKALKGCLKLSKEELQKVSDRNTINLNKGIDTLISDLKNKGITDEFAIVRAVYLYLGKNLSYDHNPRYTTTYQYATKINEETLYEVDRNVVCYTWSKLFKESLIRAGLNEENVRILKSDENNNHNLVIVKIDDKYYVCDATYGYNNISITDLTSIKLNNKTTGFYQIENKIGSEIFNSDSDILSIPFKDLLRSYSLIDGNNTINSTDELLGYSVVSDFDEKASKLNEMLRESTKFVRTYREYTDIERIDILLRIINSNLMNADEIYTIYNLVTANEIDNIKLATYKSLYSNVYTRYSILSVKTSDGKVKYYFKEDYTKFVEVDNIDKLIDTMNIAKKHGEVIT